MRPRPKTAGDSREQSFDHVAFRVGSVANLEAWEAHLRAIMTEDVGTSRPVELCFDANDPLRLARFWAEALRWEIDDETSTKLVSCRRTAPASRSSSRRSRSRRRARTASTSI